MAILSKGLSGISVIYSGYTCVLAFSLLHNAQLLLYLWMSLFMPFRLLLMFDEVICSVYSLVS